MVQLMSSLGKKTALRILLEDQLSPLYKRLKLDNPSTQVNEPRLCSFQSNWRAKTRLSLTREKEPNLI
ncbi:hypothetical protein NC651_014689 [Populus alba x Populus x berolinensis]|nr:hypothetical protein NC651_014689 [Populus alba x Populus x berolinensis]